MNKPHIKLVDGRWRVGVKGCHAEDLKIHLAIVWTHKENQRRQRDQLIKEWINPEHTQLTIEMLESAAARNDW